MSIEIAPAGSIFLVRTHSAFGHLTGTITKSPWYHAAISLGDGWLMEAQGKGADYQKVSYYDDCLYKWKYYDDPGVAEEAVKLKGTPYHYADLLSVGLLQYGIKPERLRDFVASQDRMICSQLVDAAFLRRGVHLFNDGRWPGDVTPGDLDFNDLIVDKGVHLG